MRRKKSKKVFKLCLQNLAAQLIRAAKNSVKTCARHASNRDKKGRTAFTFILHNNFRLSSWHPTPSFFLSPNFQTDPRLTIYIDYCSFDQVIVLKNLKPKSISRVCLALILFYLHWLNNADIDTITCFNSKNRT